MKIFKFMILALVAMLGFTACEQDNDNDITPPEKSYTVTSDVQLPMSLFLLGIPEEYAAFKEPLEGIFLLLYTILQKLSTSTARFLPIISKNAKKLWMEKYLQSNCRNLLTFCAFSCIILYV